jgi:ribosome-binding protein aMBF1 (putative translation factor)
MKCAYNGFNLRRRQDQGDRPKTGTIEREVVGMPNGTSDIRYRRLLARLIEARTAAGLSQEEVARRLGRPQQFVSRYELAGRRLDIIEYIDVASALGLDGPVELARVLAGSDGT